MNIKGYLIDPHARTITEVEAPTPEAAAALLGYAKVHPCLIDQGRHLMLLDDAMIDGDLDAQAFFAFGGVDLPCAGRAIVMGVLGSGVAPAPHVSRAAVERAVQWLPNLLGRVRFAVAIERAIRALPAGAQWSGRTASELLPQGMTIVPLEAFVPPPERLQ